MEQIDKRSAAEADLLAVLRARPPALSNWTDASEGLRQLVVSWLSDPFTERVRSRRVELVASTFEAGPPYEDVGWIQSGEG